MYSLHMNKRRQNDQLETTYSCSVQIRDVSLKTCQKQWKMEKDGEKGSGISVMMARHNDVDDDVSLQTNTFEKDTYPHRIPPTIDKTVG